MATDVKLHESWRTPLAGEFRSPYMQSPKSFLVAEKAGGKRVFPKGGEWLRALDLTPLDEVRVVILGQDTYHGAAQSQRLCFRVQPGVRQPPSLVNTFKPTERVPSIAPPHPGPP